MPWLSLFSPSSFRGRLTLWFGGLSLAMLLCVGLYLGQLATQELADAGGQTLQISARSAADLLATHLREREREIHRMRELALLQQGPLSAPQVRLALEQRQRDNNEYAWIGVTDSQGLVLQATGGLLVGQQVVQRPWFQAARTAPYIGDVHEALLLSRLLATESGKEPLRFIDFAVPLLDGQGRLRGVLGAHAHWNWVTRTVESVVTQGAAQRQVQVLIADRSGAILYPLRLMNTSRLPQAASPAAAHEVLRWEDGADYLTSMVEVRAQTSSELGWRIILRQPLETALEPVYTLRRQLLLFGLLTALVFTFIAYRFAARISRPIEQLARTVRQIELRGATPDYPAPAQIREIDQLNRSIQSMTGSLLGHEHELEALNASLEQQVRERTEALSLANQELERLATIDALTGLNNRRRFDSRLLESQQLLKRSGRGFGLILIDADHFKQINDGHGHQVGDEVLRQLGRLLSQCTRITDFVARYGGEEFVVLLPDLQNEEEGMAVAEKIRRAVADASFPVVGHLTVSLGLSCARAADAAAAEVVERADKALYTAKQLGRNRVVTL
ncbi:MAG: diguanylate cyclase [Hylemonella sp.]